MGKKGESASLGRKIGAIYGLKTKRPINSVENLSVLGGVVRKKKRLAQGNGSGGYGASLSGIQKRINQREEEEYNYSEPGQYVNPNSGLSSGHAPIRFEYETNNNEEKSASQSEEEEEEEEEEEGGQELYDRDSIQEEDDGHLVGHDDEEEIIPAYMQSTPDTTNTVDCFLCGHFCPDTESPIIRRMWTAFSEKFWTRSFEQLAKMLHNMYIEMIYDPETQIDSNRRELKEYHWKDFLHHITSEDHMGLSFVIAQRKLMKQTIKNIDLCQNYGTFIDDEGRERLDCRVLDTQTRLSKFLIDLYRLDSKDMAGSGESIVTDSSKLGAFART